MEKSCPNSRAMEKEMKKTLSNILLCAGGFILLAALPARAQQQLVALVRNDASTLNTTERSRGTMEANQAELYTLRKRRAALRRYLSGMTPTSTDYQATEMAIRNLETRIQNLSQEVGGSGGDRATPTRERLTTQPDAEKTSDTPTTAAVAAIATPAPAATSDKIIITPDKRLGDSQWRIKVKVLERSMSSYVVSVRNQRGEEISSSVVNNLSRLTDDYQNDVMLADGRNTVVVTNADGSITSNPLVLIGGEPVAPTPTTRARAARTSAVPVADDTTGMLIGLGLFGVVGSQQAKNFSQFDPFAGGIVGYTSQVKNKDTMFEGRFNLRFQGIFSAQPRTASAPATDTPSTEFNFDEFVASRKSFDLETHIWYEFKPLSGILGIGPYAAFGGTTVLDQNEVQGDETVTVEDDTAGGEGTKELDTTRARVDNDIKRYHEFGLLMNFWGDHQDVSVDAAGNAATKEGKKLYVQAIVAYGYYEALGGLYAGSNTKHRGIGKLRVFPKGLKLGFGGLDATPVFGVELNAGRGDDFLKFFTGMAMSFDKPMR